MNKEMISDNRSKTLRVLSIFMKLLQGQFIKKSDIASQYNVSIKSIERDFMDIREYLANINYNEDSCELKYIKKNNSYQLINSRTYMTGKEILVVSKILLESRSLCKVEMELILDKLLRSNSIDNKLIKELVKNERFHYIPVSHNKYLINNIWKICCALHNQKLIRIRYKKENHTESNITILESQGIIFSEYYFYLVANIKGKKFDHPTIYRIDRIEEIEKLNETYRIVYCDRFQEGEFRKKIQFMSPGPLLNIQFKYFGSSKSAIQDRLPTAKIIKENENEIIFEAVVFGDGITRWLLSQAQEIEVIKPEKLREEMKKIICEMAKKYK